jgi:hypothetical protein
MNDNRAISVKAVTYLLDRIQVDPDLRHMMLFTQAMHLLIQAEADFLREPYEDVRARREKDLQPEHRRRMPRIPALEARIERLERLLEHNGIPVPDPLQEPRP